MTERIPTKWALDPLPVTTNLDDITACIADDDDLLMRAVADAIMAMGQYAVVGRSLPDAIALLDQIREEFERKAGRQ